MNIAILLLIASLTGFITLRIAVSNTAMKHKSFFSAAAAAPTGFGIISLCLFASFLIAPKAAQGLTQVFLALFMASLGMIVYRTPRSNSNPALSRSCPFDPLKPWSFSKILNLLLFAGSIVLFALSLYRMLGLLSLALPSHIWGGWDARYIWSLKAKFLFETPQAWRLLFSPEISWSHPDYPLCLPNTLAWGWQLLVNITG